MTWEVAEVSTETKYKAGTGEEIHANVGVQIGLRGINVTLKGQAAVAELWWKRVVVEGWGVGGQSLLVPP